MTNDALYMAFSTSPAAVLRPAQPSSPALANPSRQTAFGRDRSPLGRSQDLTAVFPSHCRRLFGRSGCKALAVCITSGRLLVGLRPPEWARLLRVDTCSRDIRPLWGQALPIKNEEGFVSRLFISNFVRTFILVKSHNAICVSLLLAGSTVHVTLRLESRHGAKSPLPVTCHTPYKKIWR